MQSDYQKSEQTEMYAQKRYTADTTPHETMPIASKKPSLPSNDKRWRIVAGTMRRHGFAREALIETLHTAQEYF